MALYIGNDCVNVSSGAVVASDEHGYKEWIVTFPSRITSGEIILASDEEIAKHYTDAQAMAMMRYVGDESNIAYHDILALPCRNESMGSLYSSVPNAYGMGVYRSSSENGVAYQTAPLSSTTAYEALMIAYSNGSLCYTPNASRALCNGDYKIQFWW